MSPQPPGPVTKSCRCQAARQMCPLLPSQHPAVVWDPRWPPAHILPSQHSSPDAVPVTFLKQ